MERQPGAVADLYSRDPMQSIIAWAWTHNAKYVERYEAAIDDLAWSHVRFFRLRSPSEIDSFLNEHHYTST